MYVCISAVGDARVFLSVGAVEKSRVLPSGRRPDEALGIYGSHDTYSRPHEYATYIHTYMHTYIGDFEHVYIIVHIHTIMQYVIYIPMWI